MRIARVDIEGFRGIAKGSARFGANAVIVGPNSSGKTTIVEALALLLGRDRMVRTLTEHDFFGSRPGREARIRIVGTLVGFEPNDPDGHRDEWFRQDRAVEKWLAPDGGLHPERASDADLLAAQIAVDARFVHDALESEMIRYFFHDHEIGDPFLDEAVHRVPGELIRSLGFFLIPANRNWDRMISFGSELFRRVVSQIGGKPAEAVLDTRDALRAPPKPLEADVRLASVVSVVNEELGRFFSAAPKLKLRLTTTDSEGVLASVVPHYARDDQCPIPARREGDGLISLQTLVLLMQFAKLRAASGESCIIAVEEPEDHVPPAQQRRLIHLIRSLTTQTIVTTHSPAVAAMCRPEELLAVWILSGELTGRRLSDQPIAATDANRKRKLLGLYRPDLIDALMHPCVLVPEGALDRHWLMLLVRAVETTTEQSTSTEAFPSE